MTRSSFGVLVLLAALIAAALPARGESAAPNVVLILADDMGSGDPGCFNPDSRIPTPNLDRLAAEGMRFTDAHSGSAVCTPTRYGLLTGRYAWRTRLERGVLWGGSPHLIEPGRLTLPRLLKERGYHTAGIGKWHLGLDWASADGAPVKDDGTNIDYGRPVTHGPAALGFDRFFGIPASLDMPPYCYVEDDRVVTAPTETIEGTRGLAFWRGGRIAPDFRHRDVLPTLTRRAVAFIDEHADRAPDEPFFLYFALPAPHTPVLPSDAFIGRSAAGPYGDFVAEVDDAIGQVLAALERHGLAGNTLVFVASDNGSTMTRAATAEYGHRANHVFRGRKSDAWEGGHRVPFIARWPGVVAPGSAFAEPVGLNDIFATCADAARADLPDDAGEDSVSFLPALRGETPGRAADVPLVHHSIDGTFAIRDGRWKLVLARGSGGWSLREKDVPEDAPPAQLYDLRADPSETANLYAAHPDIVGGLTAKLASVRASGRTRPARMGGAAFTGVWPAGIERHWIGPEYHANRLQDWRVANGRLECVEASNALPLRTVHLLSRAAGPADGTLSLRVRTGAIDPDAAPGPRGWSGFLIGAGGDKIDYRLSALVHHKPAEDGGLLAVVDGAGRVAFRDNGGASGERGGWAVRGPTAPEDVPILEPSARRGDGFGPGGRRPMDLRLDARPEAGAYTLTLTARDAATGALLSAATVRGVAPEQVDGSLALVSHLGPDGATAGHWFERWRVGGTKVVAHDDRTFGPVLFAMHTLSDGVLKMTAQLGPLGFGPPGSGPLGGDARTARLEVRDAQEPMWHTVAAGPIVPDSWTCTFRVENWDGSRDVPYRIAYELRTGPETSRLHHYAGTIRAIPGDAPELVLAAFTGHKIYTGGLRWNENGVWFPHRELVDAVRHHDPDFLFFSGDQIYEGDLTPVQRNPPGKAMLDYLSRWYRWGWAFGELTRDIPAVAIPDDHDVYHGNLWGAGGRAARARDGMTAQDSGGYTMPPAFVNAVHRTQTAHLPDPVDPAPVEQDISVYFTRVEYAGLSFAVLADRQWKSSATVTVPEGKVVNGWFQNPDFDPRDADVPDAVLLGERQLRFLNDWADDWSHGAWMKVALSQTIFANVATIPADATSGGVLPRLPALPPGAYPLDHKLAADTDSNGWPQTGRNAAVRAMRRGLAVHVAGDQHLGTTIQYGVDAWRDAGYALCVPSVANTWPRRWFPPEPGANRAPGAPPYTGDFRDGFGNLVTVYAASNPFVTGREPANLHDRAPGYGIVRFDRRTRDVTIECWPRGVDPAAPGAAPYDGWPVTLNQIDNDGRTAAGWLPRLDVANLDDPVVQVIDEATGTPEYTMRIAGRSFRPRVSRADTTYTVRVGDPDEGRWRTFTGLRAAPAEDETRLPVDVPPAAAPAPAAPAAAVTPPPERSAPNVVLILVDDLGYGDLGCYGNVFHETPHIDALAAGGMRFTSAYASAPNCAPTRACLLSGQYGPRHGVYTVGSSARGKAERRKLVPVENTTALAESIVTLPEALAAAGYVSASIGKWHLGDDPLAHGFDVNVGGGRAGHPRSYFSPYRNPHLADGPEGEYLTDRLTDEAIGFMREHRDRPFFLYLTHYAVHTPIQGKPALVAKYRARLGAGGRGRPRYAAMVESVDESVGRILATLDELDLDERTVVILLSDNGGVAGVSSMGPLRGAKGMLYEGGLRVPLIVRWPGRVRAGSTTDVPVAAIDLFPTILEMVRLTAPPGAGLDGVSLAPLLSGAAPPDRAALFWHFPCYLEGRGGRTPGWRTTPARAVRLGRHKLIEFFEDGGLELYDLDADPGERRNLAGAEPDVTRALHAAMLAWSERVGAPVPSEPNPRYDPSADRAGGADD